MKIATSDNSQPPIAKAATIDATMTVRFTDWTRADRTKRQIIAAIEACETISELEKYMIAEDLMLEALFLFDNEMCGDVEDAYRDHKSILSHGTDTGAPVAITPTAQSNVLGKTF